MTGEKVVKIEKLLNLTTSDSDGESLNAIRTANAILKKENKTWGDLLHPVVVQEPRHTSPQQPTDFEMLQFLKGCDLGTSGTRQFVDSLWHFYKRRGYLTTKQLTALQDIYRSYYYR